MKMEQQCFRREQGKRHRLFRQGEVPTSVLREHLPSIVGGCAVRQLQPCIDLASYYASTSAEALHRPLDVVVHSVMRQRRRLHLGVELERVHRQQQQIKDLRRVRNERSGWLLVREQVGLSTKVHGEGLS